MSIQNICKNIVKHKLSEIEFSINVRGLGAKTMLEYFVSHPSNHMHAHFLLVATPILGHILLFCYVGACPTVSYKAIYS